MIDLPLDGLKIVSVEQFGAAPYATMFLADFGAEVIKVENPDGDYARKSGPQTLGKNDSLYYQAFNLNKHCISLDLKDDKDRSLFDKMVADCDVVVNNLRGNLPAKMGIDYAALSKINPQIVCGHISAYGRDNSRADWPGYDFLMQAETGFMALSGPPDTEPSRLGLSMVDYMAGMMMAFSLVSAVRGAERSGKGADIDVSLFDSALHQLAYQGTWYLNEKIVTPKQKRAAHPSNSPVQLYKAADGWIYVCCMNDKFWTILVKLIDQPDLAIDPRFVTMQERSDNRDELTEILDLVFEQRTKSDWMEILAGLVPAAPVESLEGALENPFVQEVRMTNQLQHQSGKAMTVLSNPILINGERVPQKSAPALDKDGAMLRERYGTS